MQSSNFTDLKGILSLLILVGLLLSACAVTAVGYWITIS